MNKPLKSVLYGFALAASLATTSAVAALVDMGTVTFDDSSSLYWLDVSESGGLSYDDAVAAYYPLGWRHATTAELNALISTYFAPAQVANDQVQWIEYQALLGVTYCNCDLNDLNNVPGLPTAGGQFDVTVNLNGYYDDGTVGGPFFNVGLASVGFFNNGGSPFGAFVSDNAALNTDSVSTTSNSFPLVYGNWLVADTNVNAVPVPAAIWLFGSGLLGLIGVARRQKA